MKKIIPFALCFSVAVGDSLDLTNKTNNVINVTLAGTVANTGGSSQNISSNATARFDTPGDDTFLGLTVVDPAGSTNSHWFLAANGAACQDPTAQHNITACSFYGGAWPNITALNYYNSGVCYIEDTDDGGKLLMCNGNPNYSHSRGSGPSLWYGDGTTYF